MAYSTQRSVSDGTLQLLMIEIEFFDKSEITAYFNDLPTTAFTWATDKSIRFDAPVPAGIEVLLRRTTDLSSPRHVFTSGAQFKASTLDEDFKQILHIAQEAVEGANVGDIYQTLNMHGNSIKNIGLATEPGDAVSLGQIKTESGSAWAANLQAQAAASEAAASRDSAAGSASRAGASATASEQSAVRSENAANSIGNSVAIAQQAANSAAASDQSAFASKNAAAGSASSALTSANASEVSRQAAEAALNGAMANGRVFDNTAQGIANTTNGQYFMIVGPTAADALALYKNNGGSALDTGKRVPHSMMLTLIEEAVLRAMHARLGAQKNLLTVFASKGTNIGGVQTQALVSWRAAVHNAGVPINLTNGVYTALNIAVVGAPYPDAPTDPAVFASNGVLRLQAFEGGTLKLNVNLKRLPNSDVWYYRDTALSLPNISEIKVFAVPVPGVTLQFSNGVIQSDSGYGAPEIDARNTAIADARVLTHEDVLTSFYREGNEANMLTTTESTGTSIRMLQQVISETLTTYSAACIVECDGPYPEDGVDYIKAECFRGNAVLSGTAAMRRIGKSKIWYCSNIPANAGPHTLIKISSALPPGSTTVTVRQAVFVRGGYAVPFRLVLSQLKAAVAAEVTAVAVDAAIVAAKAEVAEALDGVDIGWPTTALEALGTAKSRRVDFVMIGDSNQLMDGKGFDYAFRRALGARFGMYASQLLMANSFGVANSGGSPAQEKHGLCPMALYYRYVAPDVEVNPGVQNGIEISSTGHYAMNTNALLRCHYSYSTFSTGAGEFTLGVRRETPPYNVFQMAPKVLTNTGAETFKRGVFDLPAADRAGVALGFKWVMPGQVALKGPFLSYSMRVEDVEMVGGVSTHTLYGAGGQSLWDMSVQLDEYTTQQLTNFFTEVRRLQIEKGQKPIVVLYVNSGLNDQNETSTPSRGWRETIESKSATAYIDNLEAVVKRVQDIWQVNGWDERGLFVLSLPSHPVSTPDADKLRAYRKAAFSFAGGRARTSFVDFENLTTSDKMLANGWYKNDGNDRSHLIVAGYEGMAKMVVDLIQ